ncbi:MAG: hypothetical protein IIB56_09735 [Planctomycetes bacterium]|nr:hypothetical protein [Planctomycetota bacterium]
MRTGVKIKCIGKIPRTVQLPIPMTSLSELTDSVVCNPVGEFPIKDGEELLRISGPDGLFRLVEYVDDGKTPEPPTPVDQLPESRTFKLAAHAGRFIKKRGIAGEPYKRDDGQWAIRIF